MGDPEGPKDRLLTRYQEYLSTGSTLFKGRYLCQHPFLLLLLQT